MAAQRKHGEIMYKLLVIFSIICVSYGQISVRDYETLLEKPMDQCKDKVDNCYCADDVVDCTGATFKDIREIYPYITQKTVRVSITNGQIQNLPDNLFIHSDGNVAFNSLTFLNLSGNPITTIGMETFSTLPNLKTLDISGIAGLNIDQLSSALERLENLNELYLRSTIQTNTDHVSSNDVGVLFYYADMPKLEILDLSSNSFSAFTDGLQNFLCSLNNLKSLNLSHNEFINLPVSECIIGIEVLDLSYNKFEYMKSDDMDVIESLMSLKSLYLGGNPWTCTCYMDETLPWLRATRQPLDFDNIRCATSDNATLIGHQVRESNFTDMCGEPQIVICPAGPYGPKFVVAKATFYWAISAVLVLVVTIVTVTVVVCRRRRMRRHLARGDTSRMIPDHPKSPAYDRMI